MKMIKQNLGLWLPERSWQNTQVVSVSFPRPESPEDLENSRKQKIMSDIKNTEKQSAQKIQGRVGFNTKSTLYPARKQILVCKEP